MDDSLDEIRQRALENSNEGFDTVAGLKVLLDVIKNLNSEQIAIVISIRFGSILKLACSAIPYDVFNWLAKHMDTTTGSIDLENGFSFTITRESVHLIMDLPLGDRTISFCSTPEVMQSINLDIHGQSCTPSLHDLANLIKNGISRSAFKRAFVLLANCVFLCPSNDSFPSASHYDVISDPDNIKEFDWCSHVLHWLLLSVNKYQLNGYIGNCAGCGLIPVISYFEFLIVTEVNLGVSIPRLPLWSDNTLKLYAILDSQGVSSFGKLPMKHLCSTPFACIGQKRNVSYNLPLDVVSYIDSTYNSHEQIHVKKKLKMLSTNLHQSILTNTTRAISNCVDEVIRAFSIQDSTHATCAALSFNDGSLHSLLHGTHVIPTEFESNEAAGSEGPNVLMKDASTTTDVASHNMDMMEEMLFYYMERSFPPFPEIKIEDPESNLSFIASKIFTALVKNLPMIELEPSTDFSDVDNYLCQELLTKVEIPKYDDWYKPMSILDAVTLDLKPASAATPKGKEEKVFFPSLFDCSPRECCEGKKEDLHSNLGSRSKHCLSLNELLTGRPSMKPAMQSGSEFPEWNFGSQFEDSQPPSTAASPKSITTTTSHFSLKEIVDCPSETAPLTRINQNSMKKTMLYPSPSNKFLNAPQSQGFHCSQVKNSQGVVNMDNSFHGLPQNQVPRFLRYAFAVSGSAAIDKESVQFIPGNTCGLPVNERIFKPLSRAHVQSDNTISPSDLLLQYPEDSSWPSTHLSPSFRNVYSEQSPMYEQMHQQRTSFPYGSTRGFSSWRTSANILKTNSSSQTVTCTQAEEDLFTMLTSNMTNLTFSYRIFEIEERWAAEKTMALCMSSGGYINDYVMNAYVKMILNDQKMNDAHGLKIGFLKHITYTEISDVLMYPHLDHKLYEKLFTELPVGFRLEHAGLVHVPCSKNKQWFLVVGNFMDQSFDVLNPSNSSEAIKPSVDAVVHNFKKIFIEAYPRCMNFNISNFKIRYVKVPKQIFKYDSGFYVLVFLLTYNGLEVPDFSNEDLPALKRKLLFQLVSNYYNIAPKSKRITDFIAKHEKNIRNSHICRFHHIGDVSLNKLLFLLPEMAKIPLNDLSQNDKKEEALFQQGHSNR